MKYLLLASMLGAANADLWDHPPLRMTNGETFEIDFADKTYSIEIVDGTGGTGCVGEFQSFRDYTEGKDLCEAIWGEVYETENTGDFMQIDGFSPGGCWVDGSENGNFWGNVVYSNNGAETYETGVNIHLYCITGVVDAGGGDGGGGGGDADAGGGADPCPEPKPTNPADYINAQCCDC